MFGIAHVDLGDIRLVLLLGFPIRKLLHQPALGLDDAEASLGGSVLEQVQGLHRNLGLDDTIEQELEVERVQCHQFVGLLERLVLLQPSPEGLEMDTDVHTRLTIRIGLEPDQQPIDLHRTQIVDNIGVQHR